MYFITWYKLLHGFVKLLAGIFLTGKCLLVAKKVNFKL